MSFTALGLVTILEGMGEDWDMREVKIAYQPSYPLESKITDICIEEGKEGCIYLAAGEDTGYLPGWAKDELGW